MTQEILISNIATPENIPIIQSLGRSVKSLPPARPTVFPALLPVSHNRCPPSAAGFGPRLAAQGFSRFGKSEFAIMAMPPGLGGTLERARRRAGDGGALEAGLAHVNALAELLRIVDQPVLGDARTLLTGILRLFRTRGKTDRRKADHQSCQKTEALQ